MWPPPGSPVDEPEDDGGQDDERRGGHDGEAEGTVVVRSQQRDDPPEQAGAGVMVVPPETGAVVATCGGMEIGRLQLLGRPQHGDPVPHVDLVVPARAGHGGDPSAGTTPMGARAPNRARIDANRSTSTSEVVNRVPPSSIWYESRPRQASTMDGAANEATSSTVPGPVTSPTAAPTAALANWTTTRMSGRRSLTSRAVSRVSTSVRSAQTTARALARPARSRNPPIRGLPTMKGMSQASTIRTRRGSASSSTTTTCTPAWWSCSTIRSPTPCRPQTMTWPCQPATGDWSIPVWCPSRVSSGLPECFRQKDAAPVRRRWTSSQVTGVGRAGRE